MYPDGSYGKVEFWPQSNSRETIEFVEECLDCPLIEKPVHPEFYFRDSI